MKYLHWHDVMKFELRALEENLTWTLVPLLPCKCPIACKWIYKIKVNVDDFVERYKVRLIAKWYTEIDLISMILFLHGKIGSYLMSFISCCCLSLGYSPAQCQ